MTERCGRPLAEIVADPGRWQAILADPRDLHRELFAPFSPTAHPEYAGTYPGTPDTPFADRKISAESQIDPGMLYEFRLPGEVPSRMTELRVNTVLEGAGRGSLGLTGEDFDALFGPAQTGSPAGP